VSDFLAAFPAAPPQRAWNPLPTAPRTDGERLDLEWQAGRLTGNSNSRERALYDAFEAGREAYRAAGVDLPNPYAGFWQPPAITPGSIAMRLLVDRPRRDADLAAWDDAHQRLAAQDQGAIGLLPSRGEIEARAGARARAVAEEAQAAGTVGGGAIGGFVGAAGAALTDPMQLMTLPFGAPAGIGGGIASRVALSAIIEGAVAAGTQAAVEAQAAPWRVEISAPGSAIENIATAAAGGALLGGGLRAVAEGVRAVWGRAPLPAGHPARDGQAAALAADAQVLSDLRNPLGPEGAAQHHVAADAAGSAVGQGTLPTVSARPPRVPVVELDASDPTGSALDFIRKTLAFRSSPAARLRLGAVDAAQAVRVRDATGIDLQGFDHVMQTDEIRHVWRRHGPDGEAGDARPITMEDIARVPEWTATADRIRFDGTTHQGLPILRFERDLQDGRLAVIEEVRAGKNLLAFKTMYFERGRSGGPGTSGSDPGGNLPPTLRPDRGPGPAAQTMAPNLVRFNAYTPAGRPVLVEPQLMELDSLIPSHLEDGRPNPAYPHAEGVQPRDRGAAPSRDQVRGIAAALNPERLAPNPEAGFGAPIVAVDNVVESGNGRVIALRTAFTDPALAEQAAGYRAWLERQGFDTAGYQQPVLVSRRVSALSPQERRAFVREANGRGTLAQAAGEQARLDAAALDDALPLWRGGDVDSLANAPFVQRFLSSLTAEERGNLIRADRTLSAEGARRIQAAVLARAYGDELGPLLERFIEADADGLRAIAGALGDVAGRWAQLRADVSAGLVNPAMDVTADLAGAVRAVDNSRRLKLPVADLLVQGDLDADPLTDAGMALLAMMFRDPGYRAPIGRERLAARLAGFLDEAEKSRPGPDLFGTGPAAPREVLDVAGRRADATAAPDAPGTPPAAAAEPANAEAPTFTFDAPAPRQDAGADLFGSASPIDPESVTRAAVLETSRADQVAREAVTPRLPDATLDQARRIAAARDIAVPIADDAGELLDVATPGATRGARELLDEADDRLAAADQAAACLLGSAA
jgi:hypothetical protein